MELFISIGIMNLNNSDLRLNRTHLNLKKDFLVQIQQDADCNIARAFREEKGINPSHFNKE